MAIFHNPPPSPFIGGAQPDAPRELSPGIPGQSVDSPPFMQLGRIAAVAAIMAAWQPPPPQPFTGGAQPLAPRLLSPAIPGQSVDSPAPNADAASNVAAIIATWQPDRNLPAYRFAGGWQPFAPRLLSPSITAVPVNEPPYSDVGRAAATVGIIAAWQPPQPQPFLGGRQAFAPAQLSPGIPGQSVDEPPYSDGGRSVTTAAIITAWQSSPPQPFTGGFQPLAPRLLSPAIPGQSVDSPPPNADAASNIAGIVAVWQPVAPLPTIPRLRVPDTPAVGVDNPVPNQDALNTLITILASWQPSVAEFPAYRFVGGSQPFAPRVLPPQITAVQVNEPPYDGRRIASLAAIVTAWQPPLPNPYLGGRQALAPRTLSPGIPGQSVDQPQPNRNFLDTRATILAAWQPTPSELWSYRFVGGWQPFAPRRLSPAITAVQVDEPPYDRRRISNATAILAAWQPSPAELSAYRFVGGPQPYASRKLLPQATAAVVDNPIPSRRRIANLATILAAWQPPPPRPFQGGSQPDARRPLAPPIEDVDYRFVQEPDVQKNRRHRAVTDWKTTQWKFGSGGVPSPGGIQSTQTGVSAYRAATDPAVGELIQQATLDAYIVLYDLDATAIGGDIYRFTSSAFESAEVVWNGNTYGPVPVHTEGWEWNGKGPLPTPILRVANVSLAFSAAAIAFGDLLGATLTRTRTFRRFLDDGTDADPNAHFPLDIYRIDRKRLQSKSVIEWELAAVMDQQGIYLPGRPILRNACTHRYRKFVSGTTFDYTNATCPYVGTAYFDDTGASSAANKDRCGKRLSDCKLRFGANPLPTRAFPGVAQTAQTG